MDSWAIRAIEDAAMARARREVGAVAAVAGVEVKQLLWLIYEYQMRTGKRACDIDFNQSISTTSSDQA